MCFIFIFFFVFDVGSFEWQLSWGELCMISGSENALENEIEIEKRKPNRKCNQSNASVCLANSPLNYTKILDLRHYTICIYTYIYVVFVADVCMKMTKYFGIYIFRSRCWFTGIFARTVWASYICIHMYYIFIFLNEYGCCLVCVDLAPRQHW